MKYITIEVKLKGLQDARMVLQGILNHPDIETVRVGAVALDRERVQRARDVLDRIDGEIRQRETFKRTEPADRTKQGVSPLARRR